MVSTFTTPSTYQNVSTLGQNMRVRAGIASLNSRILEAQQQLASKKKASTHGGLGAEANLVQNLRQKNSMLANYIRTAGQVGTRLDAMQLSLDMVQKEAHLRSTNTLAALNSDAKVQLERVPLEANGSLQSMITALNASIEGRSLFAGDDTHVRPVLDKTTMLDGQGSKMGLRDVIALRGEADGTAGTGRMTSTAAGNVVTLTHDGGAFGMRLTNVVTTSPDAAVAPALTVTPPTTSAGITLSGPMSAGDSVDLTFRLPDGTDKTITMVAVQNLPNADETALAAKKGQFFFTLGGTDVATAGNLDDGIDKALAYVAKHDLAGASAVAAGNDFFDHNQPRIPDGPAATATGYRIDSARVFDWYTGDEARQTVTALTATPPALPPAVGTTYAVDAAAVGDWAGQDGALATWNGAFWEFTRPENGTEVVTGGQLFRHDGTAFALAGPAPVEQSARDTMRAKIDDGTWISYGMRADEAAVRDSLKYVALMAATPYDKNDDSQYRNMAQRSVLKLASARDSVIDERTRMGVLQDRVKTTKDLHEDVSYLTKEQINRVENIDEYDVAVSLTDMLTQLQASYQVTARLSQLSLTNFL
ncbi:DUF2793 domain-containing protein [Caenispirillum bisanense]|uniref:DUF2793 domain-containing protein n=1 Tax=Caenispirillum bisanense TaxID=414052 RepID=UPI0031D63909